MNALATRQAAVQRLRTERFDVLVVGAGITGAGVALDAAARGLRVALVDQGDFASGTSSKSSKLIHGGLRYLQQGDVGLVYEALHERQRLLRNAPHLVRVLPFMIPVMTRDGVVSRKIARALGSALWMYDLTGGWRVGRLHRRLRADKAIAHMPTMNAEKLSSAYLYFDAEADDARLTLALAQSAVDRGAVVVNYCGVTALRKDGNSNALSGASIRTHEGEEFDVNAHVVVNATGVWGDALRRMDEGGDSTTIRPAKGIHITVPWELVRNDIAVVIPVPGDKRSLFVVPHMPNGDGTYRYTYVGTTDTDYRGSIDDPQCTRSDIDYCLRALNKAVTGGRAITPDDVVGTWAGLRPLVVSSDGSDVKGRTADLSRRHKVIVSDTGMVTITGGKLTTYRKMAEHTVDTALEVIRRRLDSPQGSTNSDPHMPRVRRCVTKRLALHGATSRDRDDHLVSRFGTQAGAVRQLISDDPSLGTPLVGGLPYLRAEALYAARHEMVVTLEDVLSRRLRGLLYDRNATRHAAETTAQLIAPELGWDATRVNEEVKRFLELCAHEVEFATA